MRKDRFLGVMLCVTSGLLALNLVLGSGSSVLNSAQASATPTSSQTATNTTSANRVRAVGGFPVAGLQSVVAVGDGRSFVVANTTGFMVYQVEAVSSNQ